MRDHQHVPASKQATIITFLPPSLFPSSSLSSLSSSLSLFSLSLFSLQYNVILANGIKPANGQAPSFDYHDPQAYMDRGEVENELKVR